MATVAASLDRCNVPGRSNQEGLAIDQVEYGLGIHNEPGVQRDRLPSLQLAVKKTLNMLFTLKQGMWSPYPGQNVVAILNNLGGLSVLELGVITSEVSAQLLDRGVKVSRLLSGTFVTSLDGPGFSITLLQLDDELEALLDAPTTAPAWPRSIAVSSAEDVAARAITHQREYTRSAVTGNTGVNSEFPSVTDLSREKAHPGSSNHHSFLITPPTHHKLCRRCNQTRRANNHRI